MNVDESADNSLVEYYTIDGRKVDGANLNKGIYIKRTANGSMKVIF